ncbi:MAG: type 1 glutamine amidotransferase [Mycobacterium sp.]
MPPTVLFVRNDPIAPEAMLGEAFADNGFDISTFDVVSADRVDDPAFDVAFPDPRDVDVIVPLGARWPVYNQALRSTWVGAEMQMLRNADGAGVPVLGVCFGGQLLAQTFGGTVARSPAPEIGWYPVDTDDPGLVAPGPWFEWHFDRFTVPPGATQVARNACAAQAFVLRRNMGLQFHPEVDDALLELWIGDDAGRDLAACGVSADDLRAATASDRAGAAHRIRTLVGNFLDCVARRPLEVQGASRPN